MAREQAEIAGKAMTPKETIVTPETTSPETIITPEHKSPEEIIHEEAEIAGKATIPKAATDAPETSSPERTMTVEEWSAEPVYGACNNCASPSDGGVHCLACYEFFICTNCEGCAIATHHSTEGVCYEQWMKLDEPRFVGEQITPQ